jgi:hypothetical protein
VIKTLRFSQAARKHRIGKAPAFHVMVTGPVIEETDPKSGDLDLIWTGPDSQGVGLTIVAVEKDDCLIVTHVQPAYRRRKP